MVPREPRQASQHLVAVVHVEDIEGVCHDVECISIARVDCVPPPGYLKQVVRVRKALVQHPDAPQTVQDVHAKGFLEEAVRYFAH